MATTKQQIIEGAFSDLGIANYVFDINADETQDALRKLDQLAAQWDGKGLRISYRLPINPASSTPAETSNVADIYVSALIMNLALRIAPSYGKVVSPDMRMMAKQAYLDLMSSVAQRDKVEMQYPSTLPFGTGNKPYRGDVTLQYYIPADPINTGDGILET